MTGTLYVVPTPIGNLEDITLRALRVLREVSFIAAEDTRHTRKLLTHFEIHPEVLFSYREHNMQAAGERIKESLEAGKSGALVSDAGMPAISDPGYALIAELVAIPLPVVVLPGANALLTALVGSGLATDAFSFYGFLHRGKKARKVLLQSLRERRETLVFYESPHRIEATLADLYAAFGNRTVVIAKELSKMHERYVRGRLSEAVDLLQELVVKGEMVLILEGNHGDEEPLPKVGPPTSETIKMSVDSLVATGMAKKDAMREVAKQTGLSRRDVYQLFVLYK